MSLLFQGNAEICFLNLSMVPGLKPIKPRGAMYMMVSCITVHNTCNHSMT